MQAHRSAIFSSLIAVVAFSGACGVLDTDSYALRPGQLEVEMINASFDSLPDTVRLGDTIEVSAITQGPASDDLPPSETRVEMDGNVATIRPFDYYWTEGEHTSGAVFHPHVVSIAFNQPGPGEIRIEGVNHARAPLTMTRTIWIEGR